jgi:hypothetical protein
MRHPILTRSVNEADAWIERVIEASQASDGPDAEEFSTYLVMCDIGDDDDRSGCLNRLQSRETSYDVRLTGSADDNAERPAVQQD